MLGKDYMLAIILVNCDGVHRGSRWEDRELRGDEGARKATPASKTGRGVRLGVRTREQMNRDLCTAVSKVGSLDPQAEPSALSCAFWVGGRVMTKCYSERTYMPSFSNPTFL